MSIWFPNGGGSGPTTNVGVLNAIASSQTSGLVGATAFDADMTVIVTPQVVGLRAANNATEHVTSSAQIVGLRAANNATEDVVSSVQTSAIVGVQISPFAPANVGGFVFGLRGDRSTVTLDASSEASTWTTIAGAPHTFSPVAYYTVNELDFGGHAAMAFDAGAQQCPIDAAAATLSGAHWSFYLVSVVEAIAGRPIVSAFGATASLDVIPRDVNGNVAVNWIDDAGHVASATGTTYIDNAAYGLLFTWDETALDLLVYQEGALIETLHLAGLTGSTFTNSNLAIDSTMVLQCICRIAEFDLYNQTLSGADATALQTYRASYYGAVPWRPQIDLIAKLVQYYEAADIGRMWNGSNVRPADANHANPTRIFDMMDPTITDHSNCTNPANSPELFFNAGNEFSNPSPTGRSGLDYSVQSQSGMVAGTATTIVEAWTIFQNNAEKPVTFEGIIGPLTITGADVEAITDAGTGTLLAGEVDLVDLDGSGVDDPFLSVTPAWNEFRTGRFKFTGGNIWTTKQAVIGNDRSGIPNREWGGQILYSARFSSALTAPEETKMSAWSVDRQKPRRAARILFYLGCDCRGNGFDASAPENVFHRQAAANLSPSVEARTGTTRGTWADFVVQGTKPWELYYLADSDNKFAVFLLGLDDFLAGASVADTIAKMLTIVAALKAIGWTVFICTEIDASGTGCAGWTAWRGDPLGGTPPPGTFNREIIDNAGSAGYNPIRLDLNPDAGPVGASTNFTNYNLDRIHGLDPLYISMGATMATAMQPFVV